MIIQPRRFESIVDTRGIASNELQGWIDQISLAINELDGITGSGSFLFDDGDSSGGGSFTFDDGGS